MPLWLRRSFSVSAKKTHGLGKGMGSLLGNFDFDITPDVVSSPKEKITVQVSEEDIKDRVLYVSVDKITPNVNQPRKSFDDDSLAELSASIKNQGVLQPLLVEKITDDSYVIVAGERRFRAAKIAGLSEVPVIVKSFNEVQRIEVALIENIQRENLNAIDEAAAYQYLIQKSGLTQEEVAE